MSGKRDSDPRPQPWQGCALPTELFPPFNITLDLLNLCCNVHFSKCGCKGNGFYLNHQTFLRFFLKKVHFSSKKGLLSLNPSCFYSLYNQICAKFPNLHLYAK